MRLFGPATKHFDAVSAHLFRPLLHLPRHPLAVASFVPVLAPVSLLARALRTPQARTLFGGTAAHAFSPFSRPLSSARGMALTCACHRNGWPVARGGSQAIADALAAVVREHGGRSETGRPGRSLPALPPPQAGGFALAPRPPPPTSRERRPRPPGRPPPPRHARPPSDLASSTPNYVGGDILTGATTPLQSVFRPRIGLDPYATGIPGVFICSAATPPGAGAAGMSGYNAAQSVLRTLRH